MPRNGLIQVYTSKSDQLNFAPIGLSLRACGRDFRVLIASFAPHEFMDEAITASSLLSPNLVVNHSAIEAEKKAVDKKTGNRDRIRIAETFKRSKIAALSGRFDMVILNGINEVVGRGLVPCSDILDLMEERPSKVELVLTGQGASKKIIDRADLVTEMVVHRSEPFSEKESGPIEVITGNGKGKTTYCLGKALLISCRRVPALILQVIKSPKRYGEVRAIEKLPFIDIKTMGEGFLNTNGTGFAKRHRDAAHRAWERSLREIFSMKYGLVVLDEINIATHYGLINPERVKEMLFLKPKDLNLLLSGRNAHPEVIAAASTVIEMSEIKHPFRKGIKARKGIEF